MVRRSAPVHLYYNFLLIIFIKLCRISGSLNLVLNNNEIPLVLWLITNFKKNLKDIYKIGSLTGVVFSKKVTEKYKGKLIIIVVIIIYV